MYNYFRSLVAKAKLKTLAIKAIQKFPAPEKAKILALRRFHRGLALKYENRGKSRNSTKVNTCESLALDRVSVSSIPQSKRITLQNKCTKSIVVAKVVDIIEGGKIDIICPEINLLTFENAEFFAASDVIRLGNKCFWDKADDPRFSKVIPLDEDLLEYDSCRILVNNQASKCHNFENAFSLCGVHVSSWGHFLGNFLAKLQSLEFVDQRQDLTLVAPNNIDSHIKEIIEIYAHKSKSVDISYIGKGEKARCERLFYCTLSSWIPDHLEYLQDSDVVISDYSLRAMKNLAEVLLARCSVQERQRRLFVCRSGMRNLNNYKEVEEYFAEAGFELIEPHKMNLLSKVKLFAEATHIVGPVSSGMGNVIFCKPGTKIMALSGLARTSDLYYAAVLDSFGLDGISVTGNESPSANIHQSFTIPVSRIRKIAHDIQFFEKT